MTIVTYSQYILPQHTSM